MTAKAKKGDTVMIHYDLKDENGSVIETTKNKLPVKFCLGRDRVIPALEKGIKGMQPGESKTIDVRPEDGFGTVQKDLIFTVKKNLLPKDVQQAIDRSVDSKKDAEINTRLKVTEKENGSIKFDANHHLTGKRLELFVQVLDVRG